MVIGSPSLSDSDESYQLSTLEYSGAGFASGFLVRTVIQPLDVLKIRFQLQEEPLRRKCRGKYHGLFQSVSLIYKEEGLRAFWKGYVPAQGLSAVYGFVQFSIFEYLSKRSKDLSIFYNNQMSDFICGAVAGCSATTASMPLDVIRTRLVAQGSPKTYRSSSHAFYKIWRVEGIRGYFLGLMPSLLQIFPFAGLQFMFYNALSGLWIDVVRTKGIFLDSFGAIASGFLAGTMAKSIVYPLDLVRHRFQVTPQIRTGFGVTTSYASTSIWKMVLFVIQREKFLGLFKGLVPSLLKTGSSSALSFLFYESICDLIRTNRS